MKLTRIDETIITPLHIFFSWLTAHFLIINHLNINAPVSEVRVKYFGIITLGREFLCQCSRLSLVDLDSFPFCTRTIFPLYALVFPFCHSSRLHICPIVQFLVNYLMTHKEYQLRYNFL